MDVDVAKYVAKELGTSEDNITWVQAPSAQRETLISTGQVDMVVATYSITDARKEKVSFAGPYFIAGQDLLVRADDTSITGPDSLDGKKLCSVTGSTSAQKVKDKYPDVQLQEFATYSECLPALATGGVDALTTDDTILAGFAAQPEYKGKFKVVGKPFSEENYGIGLKKGDTALCEKVTDAIKKMISDGSWQKAHRRQPRPGRLQARRRQPADARRLLLTSVHARMPSRRHAGGTASARARSLTAKGAPMLEILEKYDVLAAFWMTIKLTFFSAIGSLVIGTVLAVMRVVARRRSCAGSGRSTSTRCATPR